MGRNPFSLFLILYSVYNLIGLVNIGFYHSNFDIFIPFKIFAVGFWGSIVGYLEGKIIYQLIKEHKRSEISKCVKIYVKRNNLYLLLFFSFVSSVTILLILFYESRGIPLFQGEARFSLNPFFFNFYRLFEYIFLFYYVSFRLRNRKFMKIWIYIFILFVILSLGAGYRTPVIEIFLFICLFEFFFGSLGWKKVLLLLSILILISSLIAMYRVSVDYNVMKFFKNIDIAFFERYPMLYPLLPFLSLMRYSQYTVYEIYKNIDSHFFFGYLFISNFLTLLPGYQPGERNIIGKLIGARIVNGKYMSTTPTLQGAFYADFGYIGVFFMFVLIGIFFALFDIRRYLYRKNELAVFIILYFYVNLYLSIHVGYWDVIVIVFFLALILIRIFCYRRSSC